jgi:hypothetical protein
MSLQRAARIIKAVKKSSAQSGEQFSPEETVRRHDARLLRLLKTPHESRVDVVRNERKRRGARQKSA